MLNILISFMRSRKAQTKVSIHSHKAYEFVYFFSGKGVLEYDENSFEFSKGSYYLMEPEKKHSEFYYNTGKSLVIQFESPEDLPVLSLAQKDDKLNLYPISERIHLELTDQQYGFFSLIQGLTNEIIILLSRQHHAHIQKNDLQLHQAISYIDEYFMTSININEIATECHYSNDHFRILFKNITGKLPKDYIVAKRIKLAKQQLRETDYSLQTIASNCGFEYYTHFTMTFKKKTGFTPGDYRSKFKK